LSRLIPQLYQHPDIYGSRGLFAPADLGVALVAWWSADDHGTANMTVETGERIISWIDRIGGLDYTAGTGTTARPTWSATAFTGFDGVTKSGVIFDGVANCLTGVVTGLPVSNTPGDLWVVAGGPVSADANARNVFTYGGTTGGTLRRVSKSSSDNASVSDGTITAGGGANPSPWVGVSKIVDGIFAATTIDIQFNGVTGLQGTGATLNTGTTRGRMGANTVASPGNFWLGSIRHVFVTTALTAVQRDQLLGWIAWDSGMVGARPA
jgi:hypothetical protein